MGYASEAVFSEPYVKANVFLGLIYYELNSLLVASHILDYIAVHVRFGLERYLLICYESWKYLTSL